MEAIDRGIRERLHRAGEEITARPLHPDGARGVHAPRSWRPLLAAVALAVMVGGVAGGFGLHSRLGSHTGGPATAPPPGNPPAVSTAAPTPSYAAAPFVSMFNAVQTGWDSTHKQVVAYVAASPKAGPGVAQVWTWDGRWQQQNASGGPGINEGGIWLDDPALHGMVLVGGNAAMSSGNWLWDGRAWTALPDTPSQDCMGPAQGAYDVQRKQLVVLFSDMCSGGSRILATETWTLDGRTWHQRADTPGNGPSAMAWDPEAKAVVLAGPDGAGKARAWTWTGSAWSRGSASTAAWPQASTAAGWDARSGALVVYADRPGTGNGAARAIAYRKGGFTEIPQTAAPMYTQGVFADTSDGRLLALGQLAQPASATPAPWDEDKEYYVIAWTGATWTPLLDISALRTP